MKNKFFYLITSILYAGASTSATASPQSRDTIYIYERVMVYDTIYRVVTLYDTLDVHYNSRVKNKVPELNILYIDTLRNTASLLSVSKDSTATFSLDNIILNVNSNKLKNTESMKKTTFVGLMLLAFQTISFAQMDFGIHVGSGVWWTNVNKSVADTEAKPIGNVGFDVTYNFKNGLFVKMEPSFLYLSSNYGYKTMAFDVVWNSSIKKIPSSLPTDISGWTPSVGDELATKNISQISIPLHIGYKIKDFKPFVGMEYGYRFEKDFDLKKNCWSFTAGLSYNISNNVSIAASYTRGLTIDVERIGAAVDAQTGKVVTVDKYGWKSNRVGISLHYLFGKKEKASPKSIE